MTESIRREHWINVYADRISEAVADVEYWMPCPPQGTSLIYTLTIQRSHSNKPDPEALTYTDDLQCAIKRLLSMKDIALDESSSEGWQMEYPYRDGADAIIRIDKAGRPSAMVALWNGKYKYEGKKNMTIQLSTSTLLEERMK